MRLPAPDAPARDRAAFFVGEARAWFRLAATERDAGRRSSLYDQGAAELARARAELDRR